jgi:thiol-disulfide isomerase/thioredoxin
MNPGTVLSRRSALLTTAFAGAARLFAIDVRQDVPRFSAKTLDGERITNQSLKGKPALLQFWATWCPYCKGDQPAVETIVQEFAGRLVVIGVDVGESKQKVKKFLAATPRSCKIVLTEDTNLAAMFGPRSFPLYVLIDSEGKIADTQHGAGGEGALRRLLRKVNLT